MARQFFRCVICGKDGETDAVPDEQPTKPVRGWVVFLAAYWPPSVNPGPLLLRICGSCFLQALVRSH